MADVQHIYEGHGDPNGVVVAPAGSHYIDLDNGYVIWVAGWHEEGQTGWIRLEPQLPVSETDNVQLLGGYTGELLLQAGGTINCNVEGEVFANVELVGTGTDRTYTATESILVQVMRSNQGKPVVLVTPVQATT